jgi:hypothetical protein
VKLAARVYIVFLRRDVSTESTMDEVSEIIQASIAQMIQLLLLVFKPSTMVCALCIVLLKASTPR